MSENILNIDEIAKKYGFKLVKRDITNQTTFYSKTKKGIDMKISFKDDMITPFTAHKEIDDDTGEEFDIPEYSIKDVIDNLDSMFCTADIELNKEVERMRLYE